MRSSSSAEGPRVSTPALECFDIKLDVVLLEGQATLGGQVGEIHHSIRNVAAGRFEDGRELQGRLEESASILGNRVRLGHAVVGADLAAGLGRRRGTRFHGPGPAHRHRVGSRKCFRPRPTARSGAT